jgi:hypothetical protein
MPCPECGAPCYYRNPTPSSHKNRDFDYSYAECIGRDEREAVPKKGITAQTATNPCGWSDGRAKMPSMISEPPTKKEEAVEQRHTDVRGSVGGLVLKDYREGSKP